MGVWSLYCLSSTTGACVCVCVLNLRQTQAERQSDKHQASVFQHRTRRPPKHIEEPERPVLWACRWKSEKSDFLHFLLRHRKLPESCQEQEGPSSSGSDSLKLVSLSFTHHVQKAKRTRRVTLSPVPVCPLRDNSRRKQHDSSR